MSSETPFDMSLVMSMIDDLYELEEQDLVGEYCTAEMMRRQGNKLLGGLDEIKTSLMTPPRLAASQTDKIMMENKVYDLNRVIEMLADLMKVDECDVREREMEMFSVAKKEAKLVLDSLKELNATLWSGTTQQDKKKEPKRKDSVDIGFNLEDVLSMIEALGQSSEDDVDDEVMLSAKEMKKRSSVMLQRLPSVSGKLDDFLKTTVSDTSIAGVIRTVEDHVGVLKRVIGVLEAVQSSPDDEVDFAVYQHYGAFQDIQREARDVLESIYSIQFGEDVSTSLQSSSKPQRKEAKRSGSKGSKSNDDDDDNAMDYPSAKDSDSDYKASPQGNNMFAHNTTTQLGSFDLSMVMSMLIDLGEDESADNTQNVENEVDLIHRQSSALVRYPKHFTTCYYFYKRNPILDTTFLPHNFPPT